MGSGSNSTTGRGTVNLVQHAYKSVQQIAKALRLDEQDEDLKAFYAKIIVYCTIIEDRLIAAGDSAILPSADTIHIVLNPLRRMSTICLEGSSHASIDIWLRELKLIQDKIRTIRDNSKKITIIGSQLKLGTTPGDHSEIATSLDQCEEELRVRYPEDPSQWTTEDLGPQLGIAEPTYAVRSAAQSIFEAMVACKDCPCTPAHDLSARLSLGTYRRPEPESDAELNEVDFNMFLSSRDDWQEVIIHTTKDKQVRMVVSEGPEIPAKIKSSSAIRTMKVKSICEQITKISSRTSYRLVFKIIRNQLYKLQSERSCGSDYNSHNAVSLDEFLRNRSGSFTEKTKRILAVILSSATFHLYNTPWLLPGWNSSDVWFFRTSSSIIPLKPFIHRPLSSLDHATNDCGSVYGVSQEGSINTEDLDPDDMDPDDVLGHNCPALIILATMLLEIYFVAPFDILARKYNVFLESQSQSTAFSRYMDVNCVFQACRKEIPENSQFYLAVENCLDPNVWQDENGNILDDLTLRSKIYSEVVLPLETELSQAYSDIQIQDLDRFAQNVDFGSWGQLSQAWEQQNHAPVLQSIDKIYESIDRCRRDSPGLRLNLKIRDTETRARRSQQDSQPNKRRFSRSPSGAETESLSSQLPLLTDAQAFTRSSYTVGILCALPLELLAVRALFDVKHCNPKYVRGDSNTYALGTMSGHMVVAACLPSGEYGTNAAAESASNMKRTFFNVEFCLLVGIGGGAPTQENDIRLGDVVVSLPTTKYPGVIQYDRGKEMEGNTFELTGSLHPPPRCLMTAVSSLRSNPDLPSNALQYSLEEIVRRVPEALAPRYQHPGKDQDCLFQGTCLACRVNGECTKDSHMSSRPDRATYHPEIHYGLIASGNRVLKDGSVRDRWAKQYGILCFEMEAAGVMNTFPCLVIRGICDYADFNKNKTWQHYAAATAAAYAKLLLQHTAANDTNWARGKQEDVDDSQLHNEQEGWSKRQRLGEEAQ
ncbi:uncharacterized protein FIESC28_03430 [Fusarium coffeatum]|uniref:Uncharacterized protein n=1 Tax=Fusarium coffeatum TaxID=231269 RepID=A0A366S3C2_9HYPO|nr:uncharacterized protein FIESC28_03430 [Fusarium coffeatum]RBR23814.1 hypothetical protein FIESC28_03430 [Fusarium coffeatum]